MPMNHICLCEAAEDVNGRPCRRLVGSTSGVGPRASDTSTGTKTPWRVVMASHNLYFVASLDTALCE